MRQRIILLIATLLWLVVVFAPISTGMADTGADVTPTVQAISEN